MIVFEGQFFDALKDLGFSSEIWVFAIPVALMIIDFITGFINAWAKHEIKSYKMRIGLGKKIGETVEAHVPSGILKLRIDNITL